MLDIALWLIPLLPLTASIFLAFFGRGLGEKAHVPCVAAIAGSFAMALMIFTFGGVGESEYLSTGYTFISVGDLTVNVTLRADAMSVIMLLAVTFVGMLVAIYSIGYMHGDAGYARYFAEVSLFVFSMCMLVLASNFVLLYIFWEAVGLCSYLLIGYWFQKPSAAAAARKAFLVNRIGDFGFALGIFMIWMLVGDALAWRAPAGRNLLDYDVVFSTMAEVAKRNPDALLAASLLLFMGAMGKSAQFPLHVWLPDAMEGPTPVSALIHAATMVTAGVYMVSRCNPIFALCPQALVVAACIGGVTALLAALIALTQNDLKRVMAYSTVSQLGLMFVALGCGAAGPKLVGFAVVAAMFHLFTHAFFKALLFLGSGSVMHSMGNVIDMRRFSGLRRVLPITHWTFLIGALALAGLPPFAGFWSKDEILVALSHASHDSPYPKTFEWLANAALLTSFLTAFYTFRAYFMTFWGEERFPEEAGHHPHDAPPTMARPLMVLAGLSAVAGLLLGPTHLFANYLNKTPYFPPMEEHHLNWGIMGLSAIVAGGGIALAWFLYVGRRELPARIAQSFKPGYQLSLNRFFIDEIYVRFIVKPIRGLALFCEFIDKYVVDALVDGVGGIPARIGEVFRPIQNGLVQSYALVMAIGLTVFVVALVHGLSGH